MSRFSLPIASLVFLLFVFLGASCKTTDFLGKQKLKRQQKKAEIRKEKLAEHDVSAMPQRLPIGFVHMVHPGGEFVLIRSGRNFHLEPGSEIFTYSITGAETARLKASEASKGEFLTADIVSGKPERGDRAVANYIPPKRESEKAGDANGIDDEVQVLE